MRVGLVWVGVFLQRRTRARIDKRGGRVVKVKLCRPSFAQARKECEKNMAVSRLVDALNLEVPSERLLQQAALFVPPDACATRRAAARSATSRSAGWAATGCTGTACYASGPQSSSRSCRELSVSTAVELERVPNLCYATGS